MSSPFLNQLCPNQLNTRLGENIAYFRAIKFFDDHGLYSMVGKGKLAVFEGSSISKTEKVTPTKIGVDTLGINPYLHEFFEPIPSD